MRPLRNTVFFCTVLAATGLGCSGGNPRIPNGILEKKEMEAILTEIHLADAAARLDLMPETYKEDQGRWLVELMEAHGTDTVTFNKSYRFYADHPGLMLGVYENVSKNLKEERKSPPAKK